MAKNQYYVKVEPKLTLIEKWKRYDLTDEEICGRLKIKKSSFYKYKKDYLALSNALKKGKEFANAEVENALLNNSLGYHYKEQAVSTKKEVLYNDDGKRIKEISEPVIVELTKYKPSETAAAMNWLSNRDSENWSKKDKVEISTQDNEPLKIVFADDVKESAS